ncbi:hypothetical protein LN460_00290, partial [Xanthomonas vesicatoria]|uniref:hypothetical protein n=1 Tax=Xanthomonas vesicatoria TaxID=56460 RepID=UPI001E3224A3
MSQFYLPWHAPVQDWNRESGMGSSPGAMWCHSSERWICGLAAGALACQPSRDTLQVRPCKLRDGIHAAKGPAMVCRQEPVELVGAQGFSTATSSQQTARRGV